MVKKENRPLLSASSLQRAAAGDATAVRDVLDRYGGLVWSLARRFSYSTSDAEDAVQEIFLDVWKSAARYDETVASEATFIAMIARRRLIDRQRRASRRIDSMSMPDSVDAASPIEQESAEVSEEAKIAADALLTLKPDQQQVLRLSILQGLSHESISQATGLPLGTVKTHIRRGLMRIRETLEASKSDEGTGVSS